MKKREYYMLEMALGLIAVFGLFMCLAWYPFSTAVNMGYIIPDAIVNVGAYYAILSFYILVSIPCFIIVAMMSQALRQYYRHEDRGAMRRCITKSAYILGIDTVIFLIGNIILHALELNVYVIIYYAFVAVSAMLLGMARYAINRID